MNVSPMSFSKRTNQSSCFHIIDSHFDLLNILNGEIVVGNMHKLSKRERLNISRGSKNTKEAHIVSNLRKDKITIGKVIQTDLAVF